MASKAQIFNLALGALLLQRQVIDPETDPSNEAKVLQNHWDVALNSTLEDLDLDSLSTEVTLELIEEDPTDDWMYSYRYPSNCAFFRRIKSSVLTDNRSTHIAKRIQIIDDVKVVLTNEEEAVAEIIPNDMDIELLDANTALCVAYQLALLSAPLIVGKGAQKLREEIGQKYLIKKTEAQEKDKRENFNYEEETVVSEFVDARLE